MIDARSQRWGRVQEWEGEGQWAAGNPLPDVRTMSRGLLAFGPAPYASYTGKGAAV